MDLRNQEILSMSVSRISLFFVLFPQHFTNPKKLDMIIDNCPLVSQFISVPKEKSQLSCAAFTAGIIEAVLDGLVFTAKVTAHTVPQDNYPIRTVFLIKFEPDVVERETSYKIR